MKIDCIRFCNINSLKGTHEISFNDDPLSSAGLFAITGPTGSGKSTILDVISLALYNYVPRLGKISKTNIQKMGSIVTQFTKEAWAELEYTVKGRQYRSRWSIAINKNGNFKDYEMDIIELPEERSLGLKKGIIPDKNTEIIGLNIDQFMKSIMLSQGDFSKFLQAKKEDRTKLLEEITGTHIYRQLGKLAFEKVRDKNSEIELLRNQLEAIRILEEEGISEIQSQIISSKKEIEHLESKKQNNEVILKILNERSKLQSQKDQIQSRTEKLNNLKKQFQESSLKLERHNTAKEYENSIDSFVQLNKEIDYYSKTIQEETKQIELANVQITETLSKATTFTKNESITEDNFYSSLVSFQNTINEFDGTLKTLKIQGQDVRSSIQNLASKGKTPLIQSFQKVKAAEEVLGKISERLEQNESNEKDIDQLQIEWKNLVSQSAIIGDYKKLYDEKEAIRNQIESEKKLFEDYQKRLTGYTKTLEDCESKINNINLDITDLEKQYEQAKKEASMEDHRDLLEDGKPCPLCGSIHHPFSRDKKLSEIGAIVLALDKLKENKKQLEQEEHQSKENKLGLEAQLRSKIKEIKSYNNSIDDLRKKLEQFSKSNPWLLQIADETWDETIEDNQIQIKRLSDLIDHSQEFKQLEQFKTWFEQLQKITLNYREVYQKRQELYSGKFLVAESDAIQNAYTRATTSIQKGEEQIETLRKNLEKSKKGLDQSVTALDELVNRFEFSDTTEVLTLLLTNHDYKRIKLEQENIISEESALSALSLECSKSSDALTSQLQSLEGITDELLNSMNTLALNEANQEIQSSLKSLLEIVGICREKLEANTLALERRSNLSDQISLLMDGNKTWILLNQLIGDGTGKKFSNYAQNLTLMHLLTRANARLKSLSDRYLLTFKPDQDDLLVIDTYQGDTMRAVKTLSGGETFLISLALALSLSDFASQNVQLQSLFIDEGFGTLDQETLDMAMSTLEKLQYNSGKRIGIISHVESLKERIHTQIKVRKNARGYSDIEIVA